MDVCFTGKKTERRCLCEQCIFGFTGNVILVILRQFTGITVWKGLFTCRNELNSNYAIQFVFIQILFQLKVNTTIN